MKILAALLLLLTGAAHADDTSRWIGAATFDGKPYYAKFSIAGEVAKLHIPHLDLLQREVTLTRVDPTHVRLAAKGIAAELAMDGESLTGTVDLGAKHGTMRARRYEALSESEAKALSGLYRVDPDNTYLAQPFGDGLQIVHLRTGDSFAVWKQPDGRYLRNLPLGAESPVSDFLRVGENALELNGRTAKKADLVTDTPLTIERAGIRIAGSLQVPPGAKRPPVVVLIPGAGPNDRNAYRAERAAFALGGIATFAYDKRGIGESTGNLDQTTYDDRADDVVAVIEALRKREDVDPARIVVWGLSEGAWLAPLVAARTKVSGVILVSGCTWAPPRQTTYWVGRFMKTKGFADADIREAVEYMNQVTAVVYAKGEGWDRLAPRVEEIKKTAWGDNVTVPTSKEDLLTWPGFFFDPPAAYRKVRVPVLALYGSNDINVPPRESAHELKQLLGTRVRIVTFDADHNMHRGPTGNGDLDWPYSEGFAPGYLPLLASWVRALR